MNIERILHYSRMAPIGVMRFSGKYLIRLESVPDHISCCTTLAVMITKDLQASGVKIDFKELIYRISIHDLPESVTSDVVRPLKYHHEELTKEFRVAEEDMIRRFGFPEDLIDDINHAKDNTTEGYLMSIIDSLQVLTKLYEELVCLSNKLVETEYNNVLNLVKKRINESKNLDNGEVIFTYLNNLIQQF